MTQQQDLSPAIHENIAAMKRLLDETQELLESPRREGLQPSAFTTATGHEVRTQEQIDQSREQMKKALAHAFWKSVKRQGLTQKAASLLVGISQQKVSDLMRQNVSGFSERKIIECLTSIGCDIEIAVRPGTGQVIVESS